MSISRFLNPNRLETVLLVLVVAILGLIMLSTFFAFPSADDFCFARDTFELGYFQSQIDWYTTWTGRFFSTFILAANPLILGSVGYYWLYITLNFVLLIAATLFAHRLVFPKANWKQTLLQALFLVAILVVFAPTIPEAFFWAAGAVTYTLPISLSIVAAGLMVSNYRNYSHLKLSGVVALVGMICGSNETIMLVVTALLLIANIVGFILHKKIDRRFAIPLVAAIVTSCLVYFAPGNQVRQESLVGISGEPDFFAALLNSVPATIKFLIEQFRIVPFGLIVMAALFSSIRNEGSEQKSNLGWRLLGTITLTILAIWGCIFVSYYSLSGEPPARILTVPFVILLLGSVLLGHSLANIKLKEVMVQTLQVVTFAGLLIVVVSQPILVGTVTDWASGSFLEYRSSHIEREMYIRLECNTMDECVVDELAKGPNIFKHRDITSDPEDWVNACVAGYYGLDSIRLPEQN